MQATADPTADFWAPGGPAPMARPVPEPEPVLKSDDFGMLDLRGTQEIAEYERLRKSGQYTDDATMRLRAMRATRGDETVRRYAWQLREMRDQMLAQQVAQRSGMGGNWKDYYVPTTSADIQVATGDYGATGNPKKALAAYMDSQVAYDRENGDPAQRLAAKRRARYMAARWGLKLDEEAVPDPDGGYVDRPLHIAGDGWLYGAGAKVRERVEPDGSLTRQFLPPRGATEPVVRTIPPGGHNRAPGRPGEIARDKDGRPTLVLPMAKYKTTGNWRLRAKKDPWALYDGRR